MRSKLTAAVLTSVLLAGCGGDVDKDKAQEQIKNGIQSQAKADVKYVKCPGGVKAEKGATFQCEALIPVNVTQVDENGNMRWQITSFSGPPSGTTGATGATGLAGVTPPGGATGGGAAGGATGAAGGGAVRQLAVREVHEPLAGLLDPSPPTLEAGRLGARRPTSRFLRPGRGSST